jgi:hypothetical protein
MPSLFVFGTLTVDLSKVALMRRRADDTWWLRTTGGESLPLAEAEGEAVHAAWVAFVGKFDPRKER